MSDPDFFERVGTDRVIGRPVLCEETKDCSADELEKQFSVPVGVSKSWAENNEAFWVTAKSHDRLPAGLYRCGQSDNIGPYLKAQSIDTDALMVLPDTASEQIVDEVIEFQSIRHEFHSRGFLHKRGILLWGPPGSGKCLGKDTPILMFDGSIKPVQEIVVGDVLMGDDSTPRRVLTLARGREKMYKVHQSYGDDYIVNESHILSLRRGTWKKGRRNPHIWSEEIKDICVKDYVSKSPNFKKEWHGYKVAIDFQPQPVQLDPYILGLWLGDGTSEGTSITTADREIVDAIATFCDREGLQLVDWESTTSGAASTYNIKSKHPAPRSNSLRNKLKDMSLLNNKHIPHPYLINDRQGRLELLAGLLDSDGYLSPAQCFEFSTKLTHMRDSVVFLARSLGFRATTSIKHYNDVNYYSVFISGNLIDIPTRIPRKRGAARWSIKNPLNTSITIEELPEDDYYGFEIDGNHRFLLGDFTVTHNTSTIQLLLQLIIKKNAGIAIYAERPSLTSKCLKLVRSIEPERPIIVLMEDLDALVNEYGEAEFLSLLDGESQVDNVIYVATTNYPERLDARFVDRPSRFDTIKYIGMPSADARRCYLAFKEPTLKEDSELLEQYVKRSDGFSIAHLRELIILTMCFKRPLDEAIERLEKFRVKPSSDKRPDSKGFGFTIG